MNPHSHSQSQPEGFEPFYRKSPLTEPWEPILFRREPGVNVVLGLWARQAHCNARGMIHGGLIAALADNAMGHSCVEFITARGQAPGGLVTVSLAIDYVGAAQLGQWLAFDTQYVKTGKTLAFTQAFVTADGEVIARADARFRVLPKEKPPG